MYNQEEAGWADGQLNENNERTDDLDGAAEGDNDTRISTVVPTQTAAPSRPKSRDSYYDRDMRERGEPPEYYGSGRPRNRGHGGGEGVRRRTRNESYRDGDRSRMEDYDYGYRGGGSRYPAGPMPPDRWYPDPYYGAHMGQGYGAGGSRGGYGIQPPGYMSNVKEMLERLRVEDPRRYRQWYEQYQAHRRNPHRVPDPGLPYFGAASMGAHPPSTPYGPNYSGWQGGNSSVYAESGTNERQSVHSDVGRPSGRSSVNDEIMKLSMSGIAFNQGLSQTPSINQDPDAGFRSLHEHYHVSPEPRRMTPLKYNTSHCLGVLTPLGHLIKVKNEGATIEIVQVKSLLCHLPEFSKVSAFPGPLKKDTTHKNTLIQFCQKKIKEIRTNEKQADRENFILLWELLILLLRKNGNVFGSDVSELLLKKNAANSDDTSSADESQSKNASSDEDEEEESANHAKVEASNCTPINEVKASEKFCEFLLYGHKKEALDYAMNNGLWGHALFLATKMDERTYGSVLARFANCTPFNHPLQTFYQLMSGRQPASAKSCCDESFGDWRPHLAMILSNAGSRPEVEFNSINKMGDTLGAKGHTFAAQFCYLMSQTDFSSRTKLGPLLGLSSEADNIIEATQMTEIYEFARSLQDPSFTVGPSFFKSKLNYTKTLLDLGFIEEAFAYCEEMGKKFKMLNNSKGHDEHEIETVKWSVLQISERLVRCEDSEYEGEPTWLQELRSEISPGKPSLEINSEQRRDSTVLENGTHEVHEALSQQPPYGIEQLQQQQNQQQQNPDYASELKGNVMPEPVQPLNVVDSSNFQPNGPYDIPMYNPGTNQLPPMNQQQQPIQPPVGIDQQQQHQQQQQLQQQQQQLQQQQQQQQHQPQITMDNGPQHYLQPQTPYGALPNPNMNQDNTIQNQPPQPPYGSQPPALDNYGGQQQFPEYMSNHNNNYITPGNGYNTYGQLPPLTDGPPPGPIGANKGMDGSAHKMPPMMNNHKPGPQFQDNSAQNNKTGASGGKQGNNKAGGGGDGKQQSSGWFGSILGKLSIKAPNQMILPDDKEPTIVWDPNQKKWVNTKGEEDDDSGPKGPPPSDGDLMRMQQGGVPRPPMMQQPPPMMGGGMPPMMQQPQQNQHPSMMPPHGNFQPNPNNAPNGMPQLGPNVPSYPQTQQQPQAGLPNPQEQQQQNFGGYPNQQQQQPQPNQQPNPQVNPGFNNGGPSMNGPPSLPPTGNKYKLPKNRPIRTGYVDVLNPNANAPSPGGPMGNGGNMMSPAGGAPNVPNMFIPSPISGSGDSGPVSFLTPAPPGPLPAQSQLEATTN